MRREEYLEPIAVTRGPKHYFFGYYDKSPWDATGRYMLALEVEFMNRPPTPQDKAVVGLIDLEGNYEWHPLAETYAWNWQQGAMLQWLPSEPDRKIIFNDRQDDHLVSVILDIHTGKRRTLPMPIYALSRDGRCAVTLNFARVHRTRPGYGYVGVPDPWADDPCPEEDGIYWMDLQTGEHKLIISLAQIAEIRHDPTMDGGVHHWFNHLLFNHDNTRFVFLHRWHRKEGKGWYTQMFTANPDGTEIYCVADHGMVSHFDWKNPRQILAWAAQRDIGDRYFLFTDKTGEREVVGEGILTQDGHCSYSPDGRWILTDTYSDRENMRTLIIYRWEDELRIDIGRFYSPPELKGEIRCDLHPRWSRDGRMVCVDSAHEGRRGLYVLDVSHLVGCS